jgi:tetratricopeptide (TPR) repeat protein
MRRNQVLQMAYIGITFALFICAPFDASAQQYDQARQAVARAQKLQQEGKAQEAFALLTGQLTQCEGLDAQPCRLFVTFSLGYLAERQVAVPGENAQQRLAEAIGYYEEVLKTAPGHPATVANLIGIYIRLGQHARGRQLLEQALKVEPDRAGVFALLLGDLERNEGRLTEALAAYRLAEERGPDAELPRRRIVELYERMPTARLSELSRLLDEWSTRFPAVAELGYRQIIIRTFSSDPRMAEQHLLRWVELGARHRWLSAEALERLPSAWIIPARGDLQRYLVAPERRPYTSWWMDSPNRRHALAQVALALGAERSAAGDQAGAEARWQTGIQIAPEYEEYVFGMLRNQRVVRVDLQPELASLYSKYPELDRGGSKFRNLVNSLFAGKAQAYGVQDLEAIQRHHMILGMIYAERGTWTSSQPYMNGIFQLEHALSTTKQIERNTGLYQPLPDLHSQLAAGYQALGQKDKARTTRLQATLAYLDTDQIERAGQMLDAAIQEIVQLPPGESALFSGLAQVIRTRRLISARAQEAFDPNNIQYAFREDGTHAWMFGVPLSGLPGDFVARQRFKALSDLSLRMADLGHARIAQQHSQRAFLIAVDQVKSLVGAADLVRVEKLKAVVTEQVVLDPGSPRIAPKAPAPTTPGKSFSLALPSETRPIYVQISPDTILAARLADIIRADPDLSKQKVLFSVKDGRVTLQGSASTPITKEVYDRLRAVKGVREIVVQP